VVLHRAWREITFALQDIGVMQLSWQNSQRQKIVSKLFEESAGDYFKHSEILVFMPCPGLLHNFEYKFPDVFLTFSRLNFCG